MIITLEEAKAYLRVDSSDEDGLIETIRDKAEGLVADVWRMDAEELESHAARAKVAVMFATGYLYEHREEADHHALEIDIAHLGSGVRKAAF